jgi:hypothetical protein
MEVFLKKKILIAIGLALSAFILIWTILFFLFPVSIINGETYNSNKLKKFSKQRKAVYDELFISLHEDVNKTIHNQFIKTIEVIHEIENVQIDILAILKNFYYESEDIDNTYYQLMSECKNKISFPLQNKKQNELNEIFPPYINVIKNNDQFYNKIVLNLLMEQYENIIIKIAEAKPNDILAYIKFYSYHPEFDLLTITDFTRHKYYYKTKPEKFFDYYISQCKIDDKMIGRIVLTDTKQIILTG